MTTESELGNSSEALGARKHMREDRTPACGLSARANIAPDKFKALKFLPALTHAK